MEILNPEATYSAVFLSDRPNRDGSRDFVLRLTGEEMRVLMRLIAERLAAEQ